MVPGFEGAGSELLRQQHPPQGGIVTAGCDQHEARSERCEGGRRSDAQLRK